MQKLLNRLIQKNALCEIYNGINDRRNFNLCYVVAVDKESVILENISLNGLYDGLECIPLESILKIKTDTLYIKKFEKLMKKNNYSRVRYNFGSNVLLSEFLDHAVSNNKLCEINFMDEDTDSLVGKIVSVDNDIVEMDAIDNTYGYSDGKTYFNLDNIICVGVDSEELRKFKIFESDR